MNNNQYSFLREAIEQLIGRPCPYHVPRYSLSVLSESERKKIQAWCDHNARPLWSTGATIVEAAELIVTRAMKNGNI